MLLKPGPLVGEMSGSVGGVTFARNRGGQYARLRANVTNPNTSEQQEARNALANCVHYWLETLDDAQRNSWDDYAQNVPRYNRLGEQIYLTGQQHFIRSMQPRLRAGFPIIVENAPVIYDIGSFNTAAAVLSATVAANTGVITLNFDDSETWTGEDNAEMLIQLGHPLMETRKFYKGPFTYVGSISGDSGVPVTSPDVSLTYVGSLTAGMQLPIRMRLSRADNRLSDPFTFFGAVV